MFGTTKRQTAALNDAIEEVLTKMHKVGPASPEYSTLVKHLAELTRMKTQEGRRRVNPDTVLTVIGNLLGILVIVAYEQRHPMVSKGLGFVLRAKDHTTTPS